MKKEITLNEGSGGRETHELIGEIRKILKSRGSWGNSLGDSAITEIAGQKVAFTTDSFVVNPVFFPGGNIGELAMCGTINDLAVTGAKPVGISLGIVIEEGFPGKDLESIIYSIEGISEKTGVPVVTGDTKVMERGKLDKIIINTSGIGLINGSPVTDSGLSPGDEIIVSGTIGDHGAALLADRFGYEADFVSDCAPVIDDMEKIKEIATSAKDPTRGGLSGALNEMSEKSGVKITLDEEFIPVRDGVRAVSELLGISWLEMPCEGRIVAGIRGGSVVPEGFTKIGEVSEGSGVFIDTGLSERKLNAPFGRLIPRIC